jgi:ABC-type amino acid transport substrate-binding protein
MNGSQISNSSPIKRENTMNISQIKHGWFGLAIMVSVSLFRTSLSLAQDLDEIKTRGVLRHLSIPYANFNSGAGDGLDVELIQLFAHHLGVRYEYVGATWASVIDDLIGQRVKPVNNGIEIIGKTEIRGDVIATGLTVLPWREKVVAYSKPTFPTQVWLIAPAEMALTPIVPSGDLRKDIAATRKLIKGKRLMGKAGTCLDVSLYGVEADGAIGINFEGQLNELAPALLSGKAELLIMEVPDVLMTLNKWPGKIKVLGPMAERQDMACAFRKTSPALLAAFNEFFEQCQRDGAYLGLARKYYPDVFGYFPEFFFPRH